MYVIRPISDLDFEVANFTHRDIPDSVYHIHRKSRNVYQCDCPSRFNDCKHIKMIKTWMSIADKIGLQKMFMYYFDEKSGEWEKSNDAEEMSVMIGKLDN